MKLLFVGIILILVMLNIGCFIKGKKNFSMAANNKEESDKYYEQGMKYIKLSIVISFLICFVGATFVIINNLLVK